MTDRWYLFIKNKCSTEEDYKIYFGCVISGLNSSLKRVKVYVLVEYGPNEGDGEERDRLWIE